MAIAFDASSRDASTGVTTDPNAWSHTPVGTPKGVVVCIGQTGSGDTVSSVTYGGVAMTRVRFENRTGAEAMAGYLYFLGASIPTGAQNVNMDFTGAANSRSGVAITVTATASTTEVDTHNGADAGTISNPSLTLDYTDGLPGWVGVYLLNSGLDAVITTAETGCTDRRNVDLGTTVMMVCTKDGSGNTSTTMGYTAASEEVLHSGLIIREPLVAAVPTIARVMPPMRAP